MIEWLAEKVYGKLKGRVYQYARETAADMFKRELAGAVKGVKGSYTATGAELGRAIDGRVEKAMKEVVADAARAAVDRWDRYLGSEDFIDEVIGRINRKQLG